MTTRARATQRRRRRLVMACGVVGLVAIGGGVAWAVSGSDGPSYRLATATLGSVHQTVTSTGTISSINQATLAFPVSGQVAAVDVSVGAKVRAGQNVASLDTTDLKQQVQEATAAVAAAQQALANDEASQTSGSSDAASSSSATPSSPATRTQAPTATGGAGGAGGTKPASSTAALVAAVVRAQQAVIADQHQTDLDADIAAADQAIVAANAACQALLDATPTAAPTATSTSTAASADPTADDLQSCQDAITAVQAAQKKVQADEDGLAADEAALDKAVAQLLAALQTTGSSSPGGASNSNTSAAAQPTASATPTASSAAKQPDGNSANSVVVTAEQLAADQKQIDAAKAQLAVAKQNLAQATLSTPIAGTVAAVSMTAGQSVSAGSTTATIVVIGAGQKSVTTTVGIADIDRVKKGQTAQVTVDGVSTPLPGHVTLVGVMNTSGTSGSTATYAVTIVLDPTTTALYDGAGVSVAIDVGTASDVLTVPTSAVHKTGNLATVSVYANGKVSTALVTLGTEGTDRVQIKSGLKAGQRVVLAEVSAAIPTNSSGNLGRFGNGGGLVGPGGLGGTRPR